MEVILVHVGICAAPFALILMLEPAFRRELAWTYTTVAVVAGLLLAYYNAAPLPPGGGCMAGALMGLFMLEIGFLIGVSLLTAIIGFVWSRPRKPQIGRGAVVEEWVQ